MVGTVELSELGLKKGLTPKRFIVHCSSKDDVDYRFFVYHYVDTWNTNDLIY